MQFVTINQTPYIIGISLSSTLMLLLTFSLFFLYFRKQKKKTTVKKQGQIFEENLNQKIQFWAYKNNGMFIPNTIFKYHGTKLFEVDGILITQRALIIIEAKSIHAHAIIGKGNEKNWIKVLGVNRYPIKSPILQNDNHLNHIVEMTQMKLPMVSLVVFDVQGCSTLEISDVPAHVLVITSDEIQDTLEQIKNFLIPKITSQEVQNVYFKLMDHKTDEPEDRKLLLSYAKEFNEKNFTI